MPRRAQSNDAAGTGGIRWIRRLTTSDTVVVFVHGILSDGLSAWAHRNGARWPEMLVERSVDG